MTATSSSLNASAQPYRVCERCVMDTSASDIEFDDRGVCSYCREFEQRLADAPVGATADRARQLESLVERIRRDGEGKDYDCVVGVSGGVDSAYTLLKVKELGLRPLAVHMDNGWNSELASNNIQRLIEALDVHLYTHVIDWEEYRDLMQAFFKADVLDVELLYDNAMIAVNYDLARKFRVHSILAGTNTATEGMRFPPGWNWCKYDLRNIRGIQRKLGGKRRIKTFPGISVTRYFLRVVVQKIKWIHTLDYFDYDKPAALQLLADQYGFKPYPYKHYESVFTRFYQGYILPRKFGVDKRRLHLSTLIVSGQLTREDALKDLEGLPYPSEKDLEHDKEYFLKKMAWTPAQLDDYLGRPEKPHSDYPSEEPLYQAFRSAYFRLPSRWRPSR